jgi:hypothetical protein
MTKEDLDEFEKEFGFKLLPTGFKKPLSEITKEEYRERIEHLYNTIINDDSNEDDFQMIEERIDELITQYEYRVRMCDDNLRTYMSDIKLTIKGCGALRDERGKRLDRLTRDIEVCETKRNLFDYFIRELKSLKENQDD